MSGKPHHPFYISVVGQLKGRRKLDNDSFTAEEKGQLVSYMEALVYTYQINRSEVYGFLSDGCIIQFFKLERIDEEFCFLESVSINYLDGEGGKILLGLLTTEVNKLGMNFSLFYSGKEVLLEKVLGIGGSSVVYAGTYEVGVHTM